MVKQQENLKKQVAIKFYYQKVQTDKQQRKFESILKSEIDNKVSKIMNTQDLELEVINDCYEMVDKQWNNLQCDGQQKDDQMDFMYRSAPNINQLGMNYLYGTEGNDFVMNSCQSIEDYGYYLNDQPEDISYQEDQDDRPFESEDIFDKIEALTLHNVNGSLLDESEQDDEKLRAIGNDSNISLDRAFNFHLNFDTMEYKDLGGSSYTDRVSCSMIQRNPLSRSQQKNKLKFLDKNAEEIKQALFNSVTFDPKNSMVKNKNNRQNKKKFQSFKQFVKQSNILCQILPSNDMNDSITVSKSMLLDTKNMEKSIFIDKNLKMSQHRQKLLKKIDKLVFSKSNKKIYQKNSGNTLENRQRRELKMKRFYLQQKNKENPIKIQLQKLSKTSTHKFNKYGESAQHEIKAFKRSNNLKQIGQLKACKMEKKKQNIGNLQCNKQPRGTQKKKEGKCTRKNDQISPCQIKSIQKQKGFVYEELTSALINKLESELSSEEFKTLLELDKVYKQSIKIFNQIQIDKEPKNPEPILISSLQKSIGYKAQTLEQQKKQLNEKLKCLEKEKLSLKKTLDFEQTCKKHSQKCVKNANIGQNNQKPNLPQEILQNTDSEKSNNAKIPFMYKSMAQKRQQMRKQFDFWRQIGL